MTNHTPSKALSAMKAGAPLLSIMPQSLDDVARIARMAVMGGVKLAPPARRRWGEDEDSQDDSSSEEKLLAIASMVILQGLEVGLPPMQALQTIALINGRPLIYGDAVPALLWRAGFKIEERLDGEGDDTIAHCKITRPDGMAIERSFSVTDAKRARLWDTREKVKRKGKNGPYEVDNDAPWHRFWKRMLQMRARGFAAKDGAADVLRGLYIREEYEDNDIVDVTPKVVAFSSSVSMDGSGVPEMDEPEAPADESSGITDVPDDRLSAVEEARALAELREAIDGADSPGIRMEVVEGYESLIDRMSPAGRKAAEKIKEGRE